MQGSMRIAIIFCLIVLAGCGGGEGGGEAASGESSPDAPAPTPGVTDTEVQIGSHTDLSGAAAIWGVGSIDGARMRFDEVNANGGVHGRQIRFIVEDTQYQLPRAIQAANKLINRDEIFAMTLALGTPMNNAVMPQQFEAGVPNLFPLTGARSMSEPYHPLKFTQRGTYYDEIRVGVRYFVEERGKERPCVIYQDSDYGQEILEAAQDQLGEMDMQLVETSAHKPTESEFTAAIIRLRNAGCDVVFMGTIHRDTILILEAAHKMDYDVDFVGNNAAYGQVVAEQESGATEGYYAFVHLTKLYPDSEMSAEVRAWWDQYVEKYDEEPGVPAMEGWRAADLVVEALQRAGPELTRESFVGAMESIDDYHGIFGHHIEFGPNDHKGVSESVLSVVENGRWKNITEAVTY